MRQCKTCDGLLPDSQFPAGSPVCSSCIARLQALYNVEYSIPHRSTIRDAYISLLLAVRSQAIKDDALDDWESYWLRSPRLAQVWEFIREAGMRRELPSHHRY